MTVASNGGSIALDSYSGIYNDGSVHAFSGGAGAAGGSLSISLDTPYYPAGGGLPGALLVPSVLTVTQETQASGLSSDLAPGVDDPALQFGKASVSAASIAAGGFDNVSLSSRDFLSFSGDVLIKVGQSLTLTAGAIISGAPVYTQPSQPVTGTVTLQAPYVLLRSPSVVDGTNTNDASIGSNFLLSSRAY